MKAPGIRSERLTLDAITPADTEAVYQHCLDAELQRYTRIPVPYTRGDAEYFTGTYAADAERGNDLCLWAIRASDAAPLIGTIELRFDIATTSTAPSAALGYWLAASHRGAGIMTEALSLVVEQAFTGFGLATLRWDAVAGNSASGIVAQRNGFTFRGTIPNHLAIRGELHDAWIAQLTSADPREPAPGWPL